MKSAQYGVTLTELLISLTVLAVLATIAVPAITGFRVDCDNAGDRQGPWMRAKISQVTGDLGNIHLAAARFELNEGRYPVDLAEIGLDDLRDPWGNPYQYLVVWGLTDVGAVRTDKNLKPVNTNYDVYSMGPNGVTSTPFTSTTGKDDIVMANDGDYFGLACQYDGSGLPGGGP